MEALLFPSNSCIPLYSIYIDRMWDLRQLHRITWVSRCRSEGSRRAVGLLLSSIGVRLMSVKQRICGFIHSSKPHVPENRIITNLKSSFLGRRGNSYNSLWLVAKRLRHSALNIFSMLILLLIRILEDYLVEPRFSSMSRSRPLQSSTLALLIQRPTFRHASRRVI